MPEIALTQAPAHVRHGSNSGQPLTRHSDGRVVAAANTALLEQALAVLKQ